MTWWEIVVALYVAFMIGVATGGSMRGGKEEDRYLSRAIREYIRRERSNDN